MADASVCNLCALHADEMHGVLAAQLTHRLNVMVRYMCASKLALMHLRQHGVQAALVATLGQ